MVEKQCDPHTKDETSQSGRISRVGHNASVAPVDENPEDGKGDNLVEVDEKSVSRTWRDRLLAFYWQNDFLILVILAISLARAYPDLGAVYVAPHITATWVAVILIFVVSGLGLKTKELSKASKRVRFNLTVQVFNFGVVSAIVYGVSRALVAFDWISKELADGMVIMSCLPVTVNMVMVLTMTSGGDEALAMFHAAFGNLCGVFLSPVLILGYLGVTSDIKLWVVFYKLALRVLLPVGVGQLLRRYVKPLADFIDNRKDFLKQTQQYLLIFIVYTVFCTTFKEKSDTTKLSNIFTMIGVEVALMLFLQGLAWITFMYLYPDEPTLRVMALFGCTHKTVAMGIPMISAIYENSPLLGLYTLPLLVWHPMQLLIGTFLSPHLRAWVEREKKRLQPPEAYPVEVSVPESVPDDVEAGLPISGPTEDLASGAGTVRSESPTGTS